MAFFDTSADRSGGLSFGAIRTVVLAPFRVIGNVLVSLAENSSRMEQVRRLQELSDAELEAAGTSRADEVRRIFATSGAI